MANQDKLVKKYSKLTEQQLIKKLTDRVISAQAPSVFSAESWNSRAGALYHGVSTVAMGVGVTLLAGSMGFTPSPLQAGGLFSMAFEYPVITSVMSALIIDKAYRNLRLDESLRRVLDIESKHKKHIRALCEVMNDKGMPSEEILQAVEQEVEQLKKTSLTSDATPTPDMKPLESTLFRVVNVEGFKDEQITIEMRNEQSVELSDYMHDNGLNVDSAQDTLTALFALYESKDTDDYALLNIIDDLSQEMIRVATSASKTNDQRAAPREASDLMNDCKAQLDKIQYIKDKSVRAEKKQSQQSSMGF